MKIKQEQAAELSVGDIKEAITLLMEKRGYKASNIQLNVRGEETDGDWNSSMPLNHVCYGASLEVLPIKKAK